jgi:hypothetical protein
VTVEEALAKLEELLARVGDDADLDQRDTDELIGTQAELAAAVREAREGPLDTDIIKRMADCAGAVSKLGAEIEARAAAPVTASGAARPTRSVQVPARHRPQVPAGPQENPGIIVRDPRGAAGATFVDAEAVAQAMIDAGRRGGRAGEMVTVASIDRRGLYDDSRRITANAGTDRVNAVLTAAAEAAAITAAGGVPGPPEARYEQVIFGTARRPLRDGLPNVLAPRGSLIYNISPTLDDIVVDTSGGAVGVVTSSADLSGTTKVIQSVPAPSTATATVRAITQRLESGNFADRFNPEQLAGWLQLAQAAHARLAEEKMLQDIKAGSTLYTDTPAVFGAFRDLKSQVLGVVAELRDRMRDDRTPITVLMPSYVASLLAVDLTRQQPGDNTTTMTLGQVRAAVAAWSDNLEIIWTLDSIRGRQLATPTANGRTAGFDADVEWAAFPSGAWLYLDGGQLDLGIVRDSVLNATNKLQTFFENWEAVAQLTPISAWCTSSLCAGGGSQAAQNVAHCSPQGS